MGVREKDLGCGRFAETTKTIWGGDGNKSRNDSSHFTPRRISAKTDFHREGRQNASPTSFDYWIEIPATSFNSLTVMFHIWEKGKSAPLN